MPGNTRTYKLAKKIQKINSERKYIDQRVSTTLTSGANLLPNLNITRLIVTGDQHQQRIGNIITPSKLIFTFSIYYAAVNEPFANLDMSLTCRVLIVQWHELFVNTTSPTIANILDFSDQTGALPSSLRVYAPYVRDTGAFTVLFDKFIVPHWGWLLDNPATLGDPQTGTPTAQQTPTWSSFMSGGDNVYTVKLKNMKNVEYVAGSVDGYESILFFFYSDSNGAPDPSIKGVVRLNYYDT